MNKMALYVCTISVTKTEDSEKMSIRTEWIQLDKLNMFILDLISAAPVRTVSTKNQSLHCLIENSIYMRRPNRNKRCQISPNLVRFQSCSLTIMTLSPRGNHAQARWRSEQCECRPAGTRDQGRDKVWGFLAFGAWAHSHHHWDFFLFLVI